MSDIFKKIKSIDPEDEAVISSLGLTPIMTEDETTPSETDGPADDDTATSKPIIETITDPDPVPDFITRDKDYIPAASAAASGLVAASEKMTDTVNTSVETPKRTLEQTLPNDIHPATAIERTPLSTQVEDSPRYGWIKIVTAVSIFFWILISTAIAYGFFDLGLTWNRLTPMQMAGLALLVLAPALLIGVASYALAQLAKLSTQAHMLTTIASELSQPDKAAIRKTALMADAVKQEIDGIDTRIDTALDRLSKLETVLRTQTAALNASTLTTDTTAEKIATNLAAQRAGLETIATAFDTRLASMNTQITSHSNALTEATKMSEQKIEEARVSVEGAAAKINLASDVVRDNTLEATSTLTSSQMEIERMGEMITARAKELDEVYRKHAIELTALIEQLRDEQENLGVSLEARLAKMRDVSLSAQVSAESLTKASASGRETVVALADAARITDGALKQRFAEMEDMVKFSNERAESISEQAARRVQNSLSQTRKEITRIEHDMSLLQSRLQNPEHPIDTPPALPLNTPRPKTKSAREPLHIKPLVDEDLSSVGLTPTGVEQVPLPLTTDDPLDLNIQAIKYDEDLTSPDPDAELKAYDPDTIRRSSVTETPKLRGRSGWRWRDMLSGLSRSGDVTTHTHVAEAMAPAPTPQTHPLETHRVNEAQLMANLTGLGLAPGAIVDDGCIIEAANARKSKGALAMSQAVSHRLAEPVTELRKAMEVDPDLKSDARAYVVLFQTRLAAVEGDREGIRTRLESDAGRAYLLCDGALNGQG